MLKILVLAIALVAFIDVWRARRKSGKGAFFRILPSFLVLLGALTALWLWNRNDGFIDKESDYFASQAVVIGEELSRNAISGDVTLLVLETECDTPEVAAFCRELRKLSSVHSVNIRPVKLQRPDAPVLAERLDPESFAAAFEQIPASHIVISLVGIPAKFKKLACLRQSRAGGKPFIVVSPEIQPIQQELRKGIIYAAVFPRPDARFSEEPLKDFRQGFAERYFLVTAQSI